MFLKAERDKKFFGRDVSLSHW